MRLNKSSDTKIIYYPLGSRFNAVTENNNIIYNSKKNEDSTDDLTNNTNKNKNYTTNYNVKKICSKNNDNIINNIFKNIDNNNYTSRYINNYQEKENLKNQNKSHNFMRGSCINNIKHSNLFNYENCDFKFLMKKFNYKGDPKKFHEFLNEIKTKAEITDILRKKFNNHKNCFKEFENYLNQKKKNEQLLKMYKYMFEKLVQNNQDKINDENIDDYLKETCGYNIELNDNKINNESFD